MKIRNLSITFAADFKPVNVDGDLDAFIDAYQNQYRRTNPRKWYKEVMQLHRRRILLAPLPSRAAWDNS